MTLGGDDQQPTPAEVLASIRRTIRTNLLDDPQNAGRAPPASAAEADGDDFELPAMFRRDREDLLSTSLVDRLGAALRPPPVPSAPDALSSLKPIFPPAELAVVPPLFEPRSAASRDSTASHAGHEAPVPREMPPCRDRLVVRMGAATRGEPAAVAPPQRPSPVPKATMGRLNYLIGAGSVIGEPEAEESDAETRTLPPVLPRMPGTLEPEAAAQLRPMLKQWLDDNLNRVFTEALISTLQRDRDP